MHRRALIREALVRALVDADTRADQRVYDHPWNERTQLPALVVEDLGESQAAVTFGGLGAARAIEREYLLQVSAELQPLDDWASARDELMAQVEAAVANAALPGVKAVVPAGYDAAEATQGARPIVVGRQRFAVSYMTPANNPEALL
jgi:hypothetical protein